ncbi:hypothetical protein ACFMQL_13190 [Nonomuraea fastidiosa]|jgi:hypothetical protein|uniref:hypothetical protein n=1 Tax=Nonomuraea TaxID=83681 RepID=UPI00324CA2F9
MTKGDKTSPNWTLGLATGLTIGVAFGATVDNPWLAIAMSLFFSVAFAHALARPESDS